VKGVVPRAVSCVVRLTTTSLQLVYAVKGVVPRAVGYLARLTTTALQQDNGVIRDIWGIVQSWNRVVMLLLVDASGR
jgi:hypothetical protein